MPDRTPTKLEAMVAPRAAKKARVRVRRARGKANTVDADDILAVGAKAHRARPRRAAGQARETDALALSKH